MSVDCTSAVLNYPLADIAFKTVLFTIGNYADTHGVAWPSLGTIEAKSGAGRSTIKRKIAQAEGLGIITKRQRFDLSTVYTFSQEFIERYRDKEKREQSHFSQTPKEVDPEPDFFHLFDPGSRADPHAQTPGPERSTPGPERAPNHHIEPSEEPSESSAAAIKIRKEPTVEIFHRRWNELADKYRIARCVALDENMRKKVLARLDGFSSHDVEPCEVMDNFFAAIERSEFLRGEVPPSGGRKLPFRLSISWALAPTNFAKIYNNSYDGDLDAHGNNISGPKAIGPTAAAAANVRARFRSHPQPER